MDESTVDERRCPLQLLLHRESERMLGDASAAKVLGLYEVRFARTAQTPLQGQSSLIRVKKPTVRSVREPEFLGCYDWGVLVL